jgi:drug/metabolite transporter superfamily protein YnfA
MNELIDRFRYRFQLWRREQREVWFGPPGSHGPDLGDYMPDYSDAKRVVLLKESTVRSAGRSFLAYFGIIIIASQICLVMGRFIPSARFGLAITFLVFVGLWTLVSISFYIGLRKARRQYRQQQATKSSSQPIQLTAGHSESNVSVHESAFRPAMPRFRQR